MTKEPSLCHAGQHTDSLRMHGIDQFRRQSFVMAVQIFHRKIQIVHIGNYVRLLRKHSFQVVPEGVTTAIPATTSRIVSAGVRPFAPKLFRIMEIMPGTSLTSSSS